MSMRKCAVIGCPHSVREGLRRSGTGVDGQELADGRFCWRCRARQARPMKVTAPKLFPGEAIDFRSVKLRRVK